MQSLQKGYIILAIFLVVLCLLYSDYIVSLKTTYYWRNTEVFQTNVKQEIFAKRAAQLRSWFSWVPGEKRPEGNPWDYYQHEITHWNSERIRRTSDQIMSNKTILLWSGFFDEATYGLGKFGAKGFQDWSCPIYQCTVTKDRTLLKNSAAVVFHIRDNWNPFDLPPFDYVRPIDQRFVVVAWEVPHYIWCLQHPGCGHIMKIVQHYYRDFFNWTMMYRLDSDIPFDNSHVEARAAPVHIDGSSEVPPLLVYALISRCDSQAKREFYIKELAKYIQVDIYGACGNNTCQKTEGSFFGVQDLACYNQTKQYKFHLAFENSFCEDYISERSFRCLMQNQIPVVRNGADMDLLLPRGSYINTADFKSPKDLAEYLHKVAKNDTLYHSYFDWQKNFVLSDTYFHKAFARHFCTLCARLHEPIVERSSYASLYQWWQYKRGSRNTTCYEPAVSENNTVSF